ncbi:MFS transporter [Paeniglutamicibacter cryotolerans]|uniref:UMF1 family MFS transporter n=1 Tax=Paeniglutamicibacter cryotolerans TaxID=670079 RepID=A0A839QDS7_9MICC|nr:MFS transporter [Paeniglutamicibacter cryotolerans]MBB2994299.1 UMF1 family MFS transporter [Paeniglutamicibacter cryotolerans]
MSEHQAVAQPTRILTKQVLAWASWDWGSAAINAVMTTFVFTVYLTSSYFGSPAETSAALGAALAVAGVAVALLAPITGLRSDAGGRRRFWLGVNTVLVALTTAACFFVFPEPRFLLLGVCLIALASVFAEFATVNYNAMLPQISTPATIGKVSGFGWGMGYLGGIVALSIVLFTLVTPLFDWAGANEHNALNLRLVAVFSALWFMGFGLPVLFTVPELAATAKSARIGFVAAYRVLGRRVAALYRTDRHTVYFLLSSAVFRDGLAAVFTFGGVIAAGTFGFTLQQVIIFAIVGNVVAAIGAMVGGVLDDRTGPKSVIVGSLIGLLVAGTGVFLSPGTTGFWIFGLMLCLFVGPAQSSSRAYLARLAPESQEGELFGLYATTGRAVSFLAPAMFAWAIVLATPMAGDGAQRYGILGILVVLAGGLLLLLPVRPPRHG